MCTLCHCFPTLYAAGFGGWKGTGPPNGRTNYFCLKSDEIADVSYQQVFELLQQIWVNLLRELKLPEQQIAALFEDLKASLPADAAYLLGIVSLNPHFAGGLGCKV